MKVKYLGAMLLVLAFIVFVFANRAEADEMVSLTVNSPDGTFYGSIVYPLLYPPNGGGGFQGEGGLSVPSGCTPYCTVATDEIYDPSGTLLAQLILDLEGQSSHGDLVIYENLGGVSDPGFFLQPTNWTTITAIPGQVITLAQGENIGGLDPSYLATYTFQIGPSKYLAPEPPSALLYAIGLGLLALFVFIRSSTLKQRVLEP